MLANNENLTCVAGSDCCKAKNGYDFDLVVLGGGSAAFSSAIYAADMGLNVCVIENRIIGGTCLNRGCVPSKFLIEAARIFNEPLDNRFKGVSISRNYVNIDRLIREKETLLDSLRKFKYDDVLNGYPEIKFIKGTGKFLSNNSVECNPADGTNARVITSDKFIIATGTKNRILDIPGLSDAGFVTSEGLLDINYIPETLLIQGTRSLSLEFAQMFSRFGSKVFIVGRSGRIALNEEPEISMELERILKAEGINILLNSKIERLYKENGKKYAIIKDINSIGSTGNQEKIIEFDELLLATGVTGNTDSLNLDSVRVKTNFDGFVITDDELKTSSENIFAAGDVTGRGLLVTTAAYEGKLAAANLLEKKHGRVDYRAVPHTIFTDPELSSVGITEEQAIKFFIPYISSIIPISYVPKANIILKTDGLIKMIAEKDTERLLGVHLLSHSSSETIQQASVYLQNNYTLKDIGNEIGVYPTMAEALKLCAQSFHKDINKLSCCA